MASGGNTSNISVCCNIWTGPRYGRVVGGRRGQGSIARLAPVTMATKPNQNVTGAASNGRQSGRIITRSTTLSTLLYSPRALVYSSYCEAFCYTKEKNRKVELGVRG